MAPRDPSDPATRPTLIARIWPCRGAGAGRTRSRRVCACVRVYVRAPWPAGKVQTLVLQADCLSRQPRLQRHNRTAHKFKSI